jgi:DNA-binding MarR family transcriptional regulator
MGSVRFDSTGSVLFVSTPSVIRSVSDRKPPSPALPVGALLRFGLHEIRSRIYAGVRTAGFDDVRPAHVTLFRWPGPDGRRPSEVAADVQISKQRVNDLLRDLERLDYLALKRDPTDNRARIIRLTPRGKRLHATALDIHAQIEQEWRQTVGAQRYKLLRETLAHLMGPQRSRSRSA